LDPPLADNVNTLKLNSDFFTRLAHNAPGREKSRKSFLAILNSFDILVSVNIMNNLLMTKSRELKSDSVKGQASSPYSDTGKHLLLIFIL